MVAEQLPDAPSSFADDDVLLARARTGDNLAFSVLYVRYHRQARNLAARLSSAVDPEDISAEAFSRVFAAIRRGSGPTGNFGGYLLSTVRTQVADQAVAARREVSVERVDDEPATSSDSDPVATDELRRALAYLPDSWRLVLWKVEVEGLKPRELARSFGVTPAAVSALVYRAREGLREAYLQVQLDPVVRAGCQRTSALLAGHVRRTLPAVQQRQVDGHLSGCASCLRRVAELTELNRSFERVGTSRALAAAGPLAVIGSAKLAGWLVGAPAAVSLLGPSIGVLGSVVAFGEQLATKKAAFTAASSVAMVGAASAVMITPLVPHHAPDHRSIAEIPAVTGMGAAAPSPSATDRHSVSRAISRAGAADPVVRLAPVAIPATTPAKPAPPAPVKKPTKTTTKTTTKAAAKAPANKAPAKKAPEQTTTKSRTKTPTATTPTRQAANVGAGSPASVTPTGNPSSAPPPLVTTGTGRPGTSGGAAADVIEPADATTPTTASPATTPPATPTATPTTSGSPSATPTTSAAATGAPRHRANAGAAGKPSQSGGRHQANSTPPAAHVSQLGSTVTTGTRTATSTGRHCAPVLNS